jgi:hypothetical protein
MLGIILPTMIITIKARLRQSITRLSPMINGNNGDIIRDTDGECACCACPSNGLRLKNPSMHWNLIDLHQNNDNENDAIVLCWGLCPKHQFIMISVDSSLFHTLPVWIRPLGYSRAVQSLSSGFLHGSRSMHGHNTRKKPLIIAEGKMQTGGIYFHHPLRICDR